MTSKKKNPDEDGEEFIFVAYITLRNGKRLYAAQYGKKAFRIKVKKKPLEKKPEVDLDGDS